MRQFYEAVDRLTEARRTHCPVTAREALRLAERAERATSGRVRARAFQLIQDAERVLKQLTRAELEKSEELPDGQKMAGSGSGAESST